MKSRLAISATLTAGLAVTFSVAPVARADDLPFHDNQISGAIGLCDKAGHEVTEGSIDSAPFVWKAIASSSAPAGYTGAGAKVVLAAYQPREQVEPGEWSGSQLTASTAFSTPRHPVAQFTDVDGPLRSFVEAYPAKWQGLVELRMIFSGPGLPPHQRPYPAAVLKVTGRRWKVVSGWTGVNCSAGKGTSIESLYLPASRLHPSASPTASKTSGSATASSGASAPTGSSSQDDSAAQRSAPVSFLTSPAGIGVLTVLALLLGAAGVTWRRRAG